MGTHTQSIMKHDFLEIAKRAKERWEEHKLFHGLEFTPDEHREEASRSGITLSWCGVSSKYAKCGYENFVGNDRVIGICKKLSSEKKDIVLHGPTGCGKTHLAIAILKEYIAKPDHKAIFITVPELLLKIRSAFNPHPETTEQELFDKYSETRLLVLDDLGAEKSSDYSITTLYLILDRRIRNERQTIITTNLSLEEIEKNLGARTASRLSGMENVNIKMPDYRKKR